jgi:hypothetical protein
MNSPRRTATIATRKRIGRVPLRSRAFLLVVGLASGLIACHPTSVEAPMFPDAASPYYGPVVSAVQAYLRTFKLSEKDLTQGLIIPFHSDTSDWGGTAKTTGSIGPHGHEVYFAVAPRVFGYQFMEIPPGPDAAPAPTVSPGATQPSSVSQASGSGCSKDTDCKGDRVCVQGQCAAPASPASTTK